MRLFEPVKSSKAFGDKAGRYFFGKVVISDFNTSTPDKLGSITYRFLSDNPGVERGVAYPVMPNIKNVPLVDETVLCIVAPSEQQEQTDKFEKVYYLTTVNIWNHPQHTGYSREKDGVDLHPDFNETPDTNPMLPFPGDVIFEGRKGQSLRFSESQPNTPWTGSNGSPIIIISNGQISTQEGYSAITEDINSDFASIYLTSNQLFNIPNSLVQTNSYDQPPVDPSRYASNQAIITSGRVYLHANQEKVLINSVDGVGISAKDINIDATSRVIFDAPKIHLTAQAKQETERAVLGDSLAKELDKLYTDLQEVMSELGVLASTVNYLPLVETASTVLTSLEERQKKLRSRILTNRIFLSK